jgi:hypothetical protein
MVFQFARLETVPLLFNCVDLLNNKLCINTTRTESILQLGIYHAAY